MLCLVSVSDWSKKIGVEKVPADAAARGVPWVWWRPHMPNNKTFMGYFGLRSVLPTEGIILGPCYEIWALL
jgi:hypothetical protein